MTGKTLRNLAGELNRHYEVVHEGTKTLLGMEDGCSLADLQNASLALADTQIELLNAMANGMADILDYIEKQQ